MIFVNAWIGVQRGVHQFVAGVGGSTPVGIPMHGIHYRLFVESQTNFNGGSNACLIVGNKSSLPSTSMWARLARPSATIYDVGLSGGVGGNSAAAMMQKVWFEFVAPNSLYHASGMGDRDYIQNSGGYLVHSYDENGDDLILTSPFFDNAQFSTARLVWMSPKDVLDNNLRVRVMPFNYNNNVLLALNMSPNDAVCGWMCDYDNVAGFQQFVTGVAMGAWPSGLAGVTTMPGNDTSRPNPDNASRAVYTLGLSSNGSNYGIAYNSSIPANSHAPYAEFGSGCSQMVLDGNSQLMLQFATDGDSDAIGITRSPQGVGGFCGGFDGYGATVYGPCSALMSGTLHTEFAGNSKFNVTNNGDIYLDPIPQMCFANPDLVECVCIGAKKSWEQYGPLTTVKDSDGTSFTDFWNKLNSIMVENAEGRTVSLAALISDGVYAKGSDPSGNNSQCVWWGCSSLQVSDGVIMPSLKCPSITICEVDCQGCKVSNGSSIKIDENCANSSSCVGGHMVTKGSSPVCSCPDGMSVNPSGVCVECQTASDCTGPAICENGICNCKPTAQKTPDGKGCECPSATPLWFDDQCISPPSCWGQWKALGDEIGQMSDGNELPTDLYQRIMSCCSAGSATQYFTCDSGYQYVSDASDLDGWTTFVNAPDSAPAGNMTPQQIQAQLSGCGTDPSPPCTGGSGPPPIQCTPPKISSTDGKSCVCPQGTLLPDCTAPPPPPPKHGGNGGGSSGGLSRADKIGIGIAISLVLLLVIGIIVYTNMS